MCGPAMQVAQKLPGRHHKLQVLSVGIGLRHGGMVVKHQQDSGDDQDSKRPQRQRAQIPGRVEFEHPLPYFGREQVQEDILLDRHRMAKRA